VNVASPASDPIQSIGTAALDQAGGDRDGRILIYAEVEEGAWSADLFVELGRDHGVRYLFAGPALERAVLEHWERSRADPQAGEWRTMTFLIHPDGRFTIELKYPDQVDPEQGVSERRPAVLRAHFGDARIDYSRPR